MRKTVLWVILFLLVAGIVGGGFYWSRPRISAWRNRAKAERVCRKYRKSFKRECVIKRGLVCDKGWHQIAAFKYPTFLACRRAVKNEKLKKAKNALQALNPLVNAYKIYMAYISKGQETMKLPRKIRTLYQPHFRVPLFKIQVGISRHIQMSAITDCYRMFFQPGLGILRQLKAGKFRDKTTELFFLHELAHAEQCFHVGGRNNYANMWFRHLGKSVIRNIAKKKKLNSENIHKRQPMEKQADRKSIEVQRQTKNHERR